MALVESTNSLIAVRSGREWDELLLTESSQTHLLHFSRMPGAKITSISIAMDKAFTAAGHRQGTHLYKEAVWPGGPAYGYVLS